MRVSRARLELVRRHRIAARKALFQRFIDQLFTMLAIRVGRRRNRGAAERMIRDGWREIGGGATDGDGRIQALGPDELEPGIYRLTFATGDYFDATRRPAFYPEVQVTFRLEGRDRHHVPLLLSPFAYSTYRGS